MKYKVVISALFVDGVKYRRGDIIELDSAEGYGVNIEPFNEPIKEAPKKRVRRKKVADEG